MAERRTIKAVSDDLTKLEVAHYNLDTSHQLLRRDVQENTHDVNEIKDYFKWFMKVVVGLFASAVAAFIIQGGLI
tara:strand:+ start:1910 stop:2134 length:225 start_codon:yes stop_codon:yes gene_type:complete